MAEITEFVSAWREKNRWEREYLAALERIRARIGEIYPESEISFKYRFGSVNSRNYKFQRITRQKNFLGITYRKKETLLSVYTFERRDGKRRWRTCLRGIVQDKKALSIAKEELGAFSDLADKIDAYPGMWSRVLIERNFSEAQIGAPSPTEKPDPPQGNLPVPEKKSGTLTLVKS